MSLVTSCPACSTSFHITPEQLLAHHGEVRCGKCSHVFNAGDRLTDTAGLKTEELNSPPATIKAETPKFVADVAQKAERESVTRRQLPKWLLAGLIALFSFSAIAQSLYFLRTPIAVQWPIAKPYLVKACGFMACVVELPRDINQLTIDDSDLQEDADHQDLIHLSSTLINHASSALEYPLFELSLTDTDDKPILRRAFTASEYLPAGSDISNGIPAGEEVRIKLNFSTSGVAVAGYRVFLKYP
ncbi:MAG TPA: DUF3426 domain-containing protein [Methylophilaceae bacterium]|jgi:predicted Zn finger-like uncharacterized protein